jgi:hypothetical protein
MAQKCYIARGNQIKSKQNEEVCNYSFNGNGNIRM